MVIRGMLFSFVFVMVVMRFVVFGLLVVMYMFGFLVDCVYFWVVNVLFCLCWGRIVCR